MLSQVLHSIEKKIIKLLKEKSNLTPEQISEKTELSIDQTRRGIEWLRLKGLAEVKEIEKIRIKLDEKGIEAQKNGLPERKLVNLVNDKPKSFEEIKKTMDPNDFNAAIANARNNNWINIEKINSSNIISSKDEIIKSPEEDFLDFLSSGEKSFEYIKNRNSFESLKKRPNFIIETQIKSKTISLTENAKTIEIENNSSNAFNVEADVPETFVARIHPLKEIIDEIREIFVSLGFTEVLGNLTQPSFWNFDALFTPQDHPAREMQDTFYLKNMAAKKFANPSQIKKVSHLHKRDWGYNWSLSESRKMVLRTHTTCVTIKYLADKKPDEARIFSLGRVFRNEKASYKHLQEFHQVEGIVIGKNVTLRDLMGLQKEFYRKIGLPKVKFWPTFFPYTEPSLQSMVYNEKLHKWVELFGMGIFRPEVTKPLGISKPVLAWGGGIERIAMLKYGMDDVREFYNNNLSWLRSVTRCQ